MPPRKRQPPKPPEKSNVVQMRPLAMDAARAGSTEPSKPRKPQKPQARTSPAAVRVDMRRADVVQMKRMALSYSKIAEVVREKYKMPRYTRSDAYHDYTIHLDGQMDHPNREKLAEALDRLDVAMGAVMPAVSRGELPAILAMLRIQERQTRYLGLDSPIKHDLSGVDVGAIVVANLQDPAELHAAGEAAFNELIAARKAAKAARATGTSSE